ncbi:hypothetical protein JRO89_XS02G0123000 [Xanthoceras sorbifolium]|uniref:Leucine-rich repeat-containing N-terminal plant-type domain-containing protein n=1 Tax=Xanthoceras sorbifolium TaxID=99658 RepID=A0ABQ8IFQ0_9ROSI|nr:hypothetical protein JRO89_XS02G0123000 [Xanthoceras sorbifolium]
MMGFSFLYCFVSLTVAYFTCSIILVHFYVYWFFLFYLTVAYFTCSIIQPLCHNNERFALLQFNQSLTIYGLGAVAGFSKVASWRLEEDCCSWKGVTCNNHTNCITRLDLNSARLSSHINSTGTLFHLVHLEWLNLANNELHNFKITAIINNISRLKDLNLSFCGFSGQISSELLDLSNIEFIDLSDNNIVTHSFQFRNLGLEILVEILTNLKVLNLKTVYIASSIPHSLANLSSFTYLSLHDCGLQGAFPTQIFQLPNLSFLRLRLNVNLTGSIPEFEWSNSLTALDISRCNFSGTIPSLIGNLTKLVSLDLSFNNFLGELPLSIRNLASLKELDVTNCNLSGLIPSLLDNLTQLSDLFMGKNQLTG